MTKHLDTFMNIFKTFVRENYIGGLIVGIFIFGTPPFVGFDTVVMFKSLNPYIILMKIICLTIKTIFGDQFHC